MKRVEKERKGVKNREEVCKRVEKEWKIEKKSGNREEGKIKEKSGK